LGSQSDFYLISRNSAELSQCKAELEELLNELYPEVSNEVSTLQTDLSDFEEKTRKIANLFTELEPKNYYRAIHFNNAGAVELLGALHTLDPSSIKASVDLNLLSFLCISSNFVRIFGRPTLKSTEYVVKDPSACMVSAEGQHSGERCTLQ